ncbi:hypothetical protein C1H46_020561 [Malus baccata]|uniref:Argonaute linker 1 domain-containing protein n=1 Tax=Malus baccata TaxID=106549 RepID=A0A540M5J6_MALBA|nr:hypothetical protein C1H46_020561 [Malus baccata]
MKEFVVKLAETDGRQGSAAADPNRRGREFKVALKLASKHDLYQLQQSLRTGQHESPQDAVQVRDVVLRATPDEKYTVGGRSYFTIEHWQKGDLGEGLEYWRGFYQSLRPTQYGFWLKPLLIRNQQVEKALKGFKVALSCRDNRSYKITGVSVEPLSKLMRDREFKVTIKLAFDSNQSNTTDDVWQPPTEISGIFQQPPTKPTPSRLAATDQAQPKSFGSKRLRQNQLEGCPEETI